MLKVCSERVSQVQLAYCATKIWIIGSEADLSRLPEVAVLFGSF